MWRLACGWLVLLAACSQALLDGDAGPRPQSPSSPADAPVFADAAPLAPVSVDYADPAHGPFSGGTEVTLRGRGFADGMSVAFGGRAIEASAIQVLDSHRAVVTTPAGTPGLADIAVADGAGSATRTAGFAYDSVEIVPSNGSYAGGTFVRVNGLGTDFGDGTVVELDGHVLTDVTVVNPQELTGYTPNGEPGVATLRIQTGTSPQIIVDSAFTYEETSDAISGGFGGGPIAGTVNFTVIDDFTGDGVPMAYVAIGDPATTKWKGLTDPFGEITFSGPGLVGPIDISIAHPRYETGEFIGFDATDATMFIVPLPPDPSQPPPDFGPAPPGRSPGTASGDIVFGGATAIGVDSSWPLVPDPSLPGQIKRTYVLTTASDIFSGSPLPGPGGTIDFQAGQTSWHYSIPVRPSAFALVAVSGLYTPSSGNFVPYAMGVLRNVVVGPGQDLENMSIPIDTPLDTAILVRLAGAPRIGVAGTDGPDQYQVTALIDLGGEGVIRLPTAHATFSDKPEVMLTSMAPIGGAVSDASYSFVIGTYTASTFQPYSVRIVRGVRDVSAPVVIDGFIGVPRAADPPNGGTSTTHHLLLDFDGGSATPTYLYERLSTVEEGDPVYRILARGDRREVPLYDFTSLGLPPLTTKPLNWAVTAVSIPGVTFDAFNYGQLNTNRYGAYAADTFKVTFP